MGQKGTEVIRRIVTLAADESTKEIPVFVAEKAVRVTAISLTAEATVAAADTSYSTYTFKYGTTTIATYANGPVSGGTTLTVKVPSALTVTELDIPAGGVLHIDGALASSGLAPGRVLIEVTCSPSASSVG